MKSDDASQTRLKAFDMSNASTKFCSQLLRAEDHKSVRYDIMLSVDFERWKTCCWSEKKIIGLKMIQEMKVEDRFKEFD